jgi:hypothetical protein
MSDLESSDRYQALGLPYPDPSTMCQGDCEGTGVVPVLSTDPRYRELWAEAQARQPTKDSWHFVTCLDCHGTGLRAEA